MRSRIRTLQLAWALALAVGVGAWAQADGTDTDGARSSTRKHAESATPPATADAVRVPLRTEHGEPIVAAYFFPTWWEPWKSSDTAVLASMRRLRSLGVNVLLIDTQPSQAMDRDWHWLDRAHRLARETGLGIIGWMESKGGRDQGASPDRAQRVRSFLGTRVRMAQTRNGTPLNALVWDPAFEETLAAYADLYLGRYLETGAVLRVQWKGRIRPVASLNVEAGWEDVSFDDETNARFRRWLQGQYRTVGALNRAWDSDFDGFDEIDPRDKEVVDLDLPASEPEPPALADHVLFRAVTVNAALARAADRVRRSRPEILFAAEVPYPFACSHPHSIGYRRRNACIPELVEYADILVWRSTGRLGPRERAEAVRVMDGGTPLILTHRTCRGDGRLNVPTAEFEDTWSLEAALFSNGLGFYSWNEMVDCHLVANPPGVGAESHALTSAESARMIENVGKVIRAYRAVHE